MSSLAIPQSFSMRIGTRITNALNSCSLFNLFDDAVADLFCLKTYTHGTSPKNYNSIMKMGADPNHGGTGGESAFFDVMGVNRAEAIESDKKSGWECKKRFFVFLDECPELVKRAQPRIYSIVSCVGENCSPSDSKLRKAIGIGASIIEGFASPTLKFRFTPEDTDQFICDKTFASTSRIAGFTEKPISPDHIGLYGSFKQGLNGQWLNRIKNNPAQFIKGLLKITAVVALIALAIFAATKVPVIAIILIVYAAVVSAKIFARVTVPLVHNL